MSSGRWFFGKGPRAAFSRAQRVALAPRASMRFPPRPAHTSASTPPSRRSDGAALPLVIDLAFGPSQSMPFLRTLMPSLVQKPQDAPTNKASAAASPMKCHLNQAT